MSPRIVLDPKVELLRYETVPAYRPYRFDVEWHINRYADILRQKIDDEHIKAFFASGSDAGLLPPGPRTGPRHDSQSPVRGPIGDSNMSALDSAIRYFEGRTKPTRSGTSSFELALNALKRERGEIKAGVTPAPEVPTLTEREAQTLYLIRQRHGSGGTRGLVNPKRNAKIIDKLIAKGCVSEWREVTEVGNTALAKYMDEAA